MISDPLKAVCENPLERKWIWISIILAAAAVVLLGYYAVAANINPPSNVETIDSSRLHLTQEFAEDNLGVKTAPDGSIHVTLVAARYGFYPERIEVPSDTPVTFRMASADVLHGVHAPYTNITTMIVPGYISEVTTTFPKPGEYTLMCNEYCGLGHDHMWSRLIVVSKDKWEMQP
jgi:cytochrome c oxidase subunit II